MENKTFLPLSSFEKIIKAAGAYRVSEGSKVVLREIIEEFGKKVADDAVKLALHANRKTVKARDIDLASR